MLPPPSRPNWHIAVEQAVRDARIEIVGHEDVKNQSHAETLIAVLKAYGDSRRGFVYVEPYLAKQSARPQDILVCHPEIGVLIIEVKGHGIDDIVRIAAGNLWVKVKGVTQQKNAFKQAETTMFDVKSAVERSSELRSSLPWFEFSVALPRISEKEWKSRGYDGCLDRSRLLLKEDLETRDATRAHIGALLKEGLTASRRASPIEDHHFDRVKTVFGDSAVINIQRPVRPLEPIGCHPNPGRKAGDQRSPWAVSSAGRTDTRSFERQGPAAP